MGKGCDKWVCHNPSKYEGLIKKVAANQDTPSKKLCSHSLRVNVATVAPKRAKIAEDYHSLEYVSTPEPKNSDGPYMSSDYESSVSSDYN